MDYDTVVWNKIWEAEAQNKKPFKEKALKAMAVILTSVALAFILL